MTETTMPVQMIPLSEALVESRKNLELKQEAAKEAVLKKWNEAATRMSPVGPFSDSVLRTQFGIGTLLSAVTLGTEEELELLDWLVDEAKANGYTVFCRRCSDTMCRVYFGL